MKRYQIERRLKIALDTLRVNDNYLLQNDVSERSIAHRLAVYLEHTFGKDYNVDCEYNKNVEHSSGSKKIMVLESKRNIYRQDTSHSELNDERIEVSIIPDIIIHQRGLNDKNLLSIEVKKSSNTDRGDWDYDKLKAYTMQDDNLSYNYGVFIRFYVNEDRYIEPKIVWFENGDQIVIG